MRDKALYHLLMAHLQDLRHRASPQQCALIDGISDSLRVTYGRGRYQLDWKHGGKPYDLELPGRSMSFYVRGDTGSPQTATGQRWENWREARSAVAQIAAISGISDLANLLELSARSASAGAPEDRDSRLVSLAGLALGTGALMWLLFPLTHALWTAVAAFCLLVLASLQRYSLLGRALRWHEAGLVCAGSALPAVLGHSPALAALCAAAFSACALAEARGPDATRADWVGAGLASAGPVLWAGPAGLPVPVLGAALLIAIRVTMPNRIARGCVAAYLLSAAAGTAAAAALALGPAAGAAVPGAISVWAIAGLALALGLTWWIFGQQYALFPWYSFLLIAIAGASTAMTHGMSESAFSFLAFSGLLVVSLWRVIAAFPRQSAPQLLA